MKKEREKIQKEYEKALEKLRKYFNPPRITVYVNHERVHNLVSVQPQEDEG